MTDSLTAPQSDLLAVGKIIDQAKRVAIDYRRLTGRPLGITGEVAEYEAARLLGLKLSPVREPGQDAMGVGPRAGRRYQIKGRWIHSAMKRGGRVSSIRFKHPWDAVLLVLLDEDLQPTTIREAERSEVKKALSRPGSKARNKRGSLGISQFKAISHVVWERDKAGS